jgi:Na+/H+-dicarboxylate symporter
MFLVLLIFTAILIFLHIKSISFNIRTILAILAGIYIGIGYNAIDGHRQSFMQFSDILGNGYIALFKMIIIPIVLISIVHSIINLKSHKGYYAIKVAYKTVVVLLVMTAISALIASIVAILMHTGSGIDLAAITGKVTKEMKSTTIAETILSFLPDNLFHQMNENNVMAIAIFAILLGFAMLIAHKENEELAAPFISFIDSVFFVVKKLAKIVIAITPYGVLGLMVQMTIELYQSHHIVRLSIHCLQHMDFTNLILLENAFHATDNLSTIS